MATGKRQRGCERVERMIARDAGQIEAFESADGILGRAGPAEKTRAMCLAEQRKYEITPRVHVMDGDQQLAKSGLPEILREELDVASGQIARARRRNGAPRRESGSTVPPASARSRRST